MRAGNFNSIHGFPNKKNLINKCVEILLLKVWLIKFIFWIFDDDAGRIKGIELGEHRYFSVTLTHAHGDASMFGGGFPF